MEAWKRVRANQGAAGVDGESVAAFEADLAGNLFKLWNRLSSGSYFPPPVRAVEIPKRAAGGVRVLGVPTVADRVAQTAVRLVLEPKVEPLFHPDSYGYRPGRSALDAVAVCRERCWRADWVIDLDIRAFFDSIDHDRLLAAVAKHTDQRWVLLYVQRWLTAPLQREDGTLVARDRGSPQGSAISPLLANIFLHYVFDAWLARTYPAVRFERYCDDVVVHATSEEQARTLLAAIRVRLAECGLDLNEAKTQIVYCQDDRRGGPRGPHRFDFLGYTFRPRTVASRTGKPFVGFTPAVSDEAGKRMRRQVRRWRIHRRTTWTLSDLAQQINPVTRGWIGYYGRFHPSRLIPTLRRVDDYLARHLMAKHKRLRGHLGRAYQVLHRIARQQPDLFAHWRLVRPAAR